MKAALDLRDSLLAAWSTNNRVTVFLVDHLPDDLMGCHCARGSKTNGEDDRRPHSQCAVHVDQDAGKGTPHRKDEG
jgi:hypothetical protein